MTDLEEFFRELERRYRKEKQDFVWDWEGLNDISASKNLPPGHDMLSDYVCFIAYNLAKNVIHGRLPDPIHARMMFYGGDWSRKYAEYISK